MHENKNSMSIHSAERMDSSVNNDSQATNDTSPSNRSRYSAAKDQTVNNSSPKHNDMGTQNSLDTISTVSVASNDTKNSSNDEVTIRTYTGLSATTQERIRRFELETKAMLQRDQHRQRREAEKREEDRKRIEREWQLAKREMENDDDLDQMVDTAPTYLSERVANLSESIGNDKTTLNRSERNARSRSIARVPPLSIAVQQQPTVTKQKAEATTQLEKVIGKKMNNGVVKKLKTEEVSCIRNARLDLNLNMFSLIYLSFAFCFFLFAANNGLYFGSTESLRQP